MLNQYIESLKSAPKRQRIDESIDLPPPRPTKRPRKASQHPQFSIHRDEISTQDSSDSDTYSELPPNRIRSQLEKIQPHISVVIPYQTEFHRIPPSTQPPADPLKTSNILQNIAVNRAQKVPKILEK